MRRDEILSAVGNYYGDKVRTHGATARGVDWSSKESQEIRFRELMRVADRSPPPFSLNDFGCGYGALHDYLVQSGIQCGYRGLDLSPAMLDEARRQHPALPPETFVVTRAELPVADFTVASGIFNVKMTTPAVEWTDYVLSTIRELAEHSRHGFSFNMLTSYSDRDRMRDDLYYGDPGFFFDHCKRTYSRWVALLHDYGLYEFTLIVRLET